MPATKEQLHEAMRNVGITADNPQDFSIRGYSDDPEKHIALPYEMVCAADVDELNFLAARLEPVSYTHLGDLCGRGRGRKPCHAALWRPYPVFKAGHQLLAIPLLRLRAVKLQ